VPIILNIETSTTVCSVAISNGGNILSYKEIDNGYSHAENLATFITTCLKEANIELINIDAVAVSKGPGSYTGLRIGVATAKGICYSIDKPLISVSTLQSMAMEISNKIDNKEALFCPLLDARRMEVFTAIYSANNSIISPVEAKIIDNTSFQEEVLNNKIYFFGNGSEKCKQDITSENAIYIDNVYPSAKNIATLAYDKFIKKEFENVAYFEPYYLKDFIATTPKKPI
jgi:tRNA threonylcarbamoyladenosine biosynthesis protein TsaB